MNDRKVWGNIKNYTIPWITFQYRIFFFANKFEVDFVIRTNNSIKSSIYRWISQSRRNIFCFCLVSKCLLSFLLFSKVVTPAARLNCYYYYFARLFFLLMLLYSCVGMHVYSATCLMIHKWYIQINTKDENSLIIQIMSEVNHSDTYGKK